MGSVHVKTLSDHVGEIDPWCRVANLVIVDTYYVKNNKVETEFQTFTKISIRKSMQSLFEVFSILWVTSLERSILILYDLMSIH